MKPGAVKHSRYTKLLPPNIKLYLVEQNSATVRERIRQLYQLLKKYSLETLDERFEELVLSNLGLIESQAEVDMTRYDQLGPKAVKQL